MMVSAQLVALASAIAFMYVFIWNPDGAPHALALEWVGAVGVCLSILLFASPLSQIVRIPNARHRNRAGAVAFLARRMLGIAFIDLWIGGSPAGGQHTLYES